MKAESTIQAGICGFTTNVVVDAPSMFEDAAVEIKTNCEKIAALGGKILTVNGLNEIKFGFDGKILSETRKVLTS